MALSLRSSSVLVLLLAAISVAVCQETDCPAVNPTCDESFTDIGYAERLNAPQTAGRKLLGAARKTQVAPQNLAPTLSNRRSLLAPMCSETDNSHAAVVMCTNAMRMDARAFRDEFPCDPYFLGSYSPMQALNDHGQLQNAAQDHSEDQARRGTLDHYGGDGSSVGDRAKRANYYWSHVSENVAYGYRSAKSVVLGWMCSGGHRENILSCSSKDMGVGIATGRDGRHYHTQVFACPSGERCTCSDPGPTQPSAPEPPRSTQEPTPPRPSREPTPPRRTPAPSGPRDDRDERPFFRRRRYRPGFYYVQEEDEDSGSEGGSGEGSGHHGGFPFFTFGSGPQTQSESFGESPENPSESSSPDPFELFGGPGGNYVFHSTG